MKLQLKHTADGSSTLYLPGMNEQYHSLNGALTESEHVFIRMGFSFHPKANPVVFEVGFGTGLNALLTAHQAKTDRRQVFYIAIENFPLAMDVIEELDYGKFIPENGRELFFELHRCKWNEPVQLTPFFSLLKLEADFIKGEWQIPKSCDIVYFDAFGPDKQPEMWESSIFEHLYEQLSSGGVLVTYSAKGEVRRRLKAAGFDTEKLPGPPGKKEMLRAIKLNQNPYC